MKKYLSFVCTAVFFTLGAWTEPDKKLIFCGWGVPFELEQFQIPAEKFEKYTPFDGIGIRPHFKIRRNGKTITYYASEHNHESPLRLKKEDFKEWIAAFDKLKFKKLKNNFLMLTTAQFSPDWFDDAAWENKLAAVFADLYSKADSLGGKVSGEHGIGCAKKPYLAESLSADEKALMEGIKNAFDPGYILNPGKLFSINK